MTVEVMVFTKQDCPNCPQAKRVVEEVEREMGCRIEVKRFDLDDEEDFLTALQNQVMSTPSIVVNGKLVVAGRSTSTDELVKAIQLEEVEN
jgi:glutaredoxin